MKHIVPIFSICCIGLIAVAGQAVEPSGAPLAPASWELQSKDNPLTASTAQNLVRNAIAELESHRSVSAKLRHHVDLFDRRMTGSGAYLQGDWPSGLLRLEIVTPTAGKSTGVRQICDGKYHWSYRASLEDRILKRIDLRRLKSAVPALPTSATSSALPGAIGLGGLPKLLRNLEASFQFDAMYDTAIGQTKILAARGDWKPEMLVKIKAEQSKGKKKRHAVLSNELPAHVPDHVLLLLGADDLFPYRIEYRRTLPTEDGAASAPPKSKSLAALELYEVSIDVPIDAAQFQFDPGTQHVTDVTSETMKALGLRDPGSAKRSDPADLTLGSSQDGMQR